MLEHEAVRRNLATLAARGVRFVDPGRDILACGWIGKGRLAEPDEIVRRPICFCSRAARCSAGSCVVTAGPTYEDIDAVRYIGNRSSGKMGYAIAAEAARRGARVVLVSGPSHLAAPRASKLVRVRSAAEMQPRFCQHAADATSSSWRPRSRTTRPEEARRRQDRESDGPLELRLVRTPDILAELGRRAGGATPGAGRICRRERRSRRTRPARSCSASSVDFIVANDITRARCGLRGRHQRGDDHRPGLPRRPSRCAPKSDVAARILDRAERGSKPGLGTHGVNPTRGTPQVLPGARRHGHQSRFEVERSGARGAKRARSAGGAASDAGTSPGVSIAASAGLPGRCRRARGRSPARRPGRAAISAA